MAGVRLPLARHGCYYQTLNGCGYEPVPLLSVAAHSLEYEEPAQLNPVYHIPLYCPNLRERCILGEDHAGGLRVLRPVPRRCPRPIGLP